MNKQDLLEAVLAEIEDRTTQANESGEAEKYQQELLGLTGLKALVEVEAALTYIQYEWLSYLVANHREAKIREELE